MYTIVVVVSVVVLSVLLLGGVFVVSRKISAVLVRWLTRIADAREQAGQ